MSLEDDDFNRSGHTNAEIESRNQRFGASASSNKNSAVKAGGQARQGGVRDSQATNVRNSGVS